MFPRMFLGTYYKPTNMKTNLVKNRGVSPDSLKKTLAEIRYQESYTSKTTNGLEEYLNLTRNNQNSIKTRLANYKEYMLKLYKTSLCDLVAIRNKVKILKWAIENEFMYGWSTVEASIKGKSIECLKLVLSIMKKKSIKILKEYYNESYKQNGSVENLKILKKNYLIEQQNFFYIPENHNDYIENIKMIVDKNPEYTEKMLKKKEEEKAHYNDLINKNIPVDSQEKFKSIINFYINQRYDIIIFNYDLDNLYELEKKEYSE